MAGMALFLGILPAVFRRRRLGPAIESHQRHRRRHRPFGLAGDRFGAEDSVANSPSSGPPPEKPSNLAIAIDGIGGRHLRPIVAAGGNRTAPRGHGHQRRQRRGQNDPGRPIGDEPRPRRPPHPSGGLRFAAADLRRSVRLAECSRHQRNTPRRMRFGELHSCHGHGQPVGPDGRLLGSFRAWRPWPTTASLRCSRNFARITNS